MKDKFRANYLASQASGIGFTVVFCVLGGFFLGYFLDTKFDTTPLFIISGFLFGIFSAGYCSIVRNRNSVNTFESAELIF